MIPKIKKISLARKRLPKPRASLRRFRNHMHGGPVTDLWLSTPGTLTFRIGDFYGYYDSKNRWIDA